MPGARAVRARDELEDEASSLGLYDEWYPDGEALDELLAEAAELVPDAPDAVRELADHVITRTERLLNYENCYGEGITEALEKAQDVHLAACEAGSPDPAALAERLATGALESGWGVFRDGPAKYARMLGAAGLARYRELRWPMRISSRAWPGVFDTLANDVVLAVDAVQVGVVQDCQPGRRPRMTGC